MLPQGVADAGQGFSFPLSGNPARRLTDMASKLPIEVCVVDDIRPHPNADRLAIVRIKGWQAVVGRAEFKQGDRVVYFPPDARLPQYVSDAMNVTKYLKGSDDNKRVGQIRLRGEPSFGLVVPLPERLREAAVGDDVAAYFGVTKWEPPVLGQAGDVLGYEHPLFQRYTDIENLRNFPNAFEEGEDVIITEKIHGTNVRIGRIGGELMAGSHNLARKRPDAEEEMARNFYWYPLTLEPVKALLASVPGNQVILYGETYGRVQNLHYGHGRDLAFAAFDLLVDGHFLDWWEFTQRCRECGVATVPIVNETAYYSLASVAAHSRGRSLLAGAEHMREGVVVKPAAERYSEVLKGRLIGKYLNDDYLLSKESEKDTTDA